MTFNEAYSLHGPDVEAIAKDVGISPSYADILINARMEQKYRRRRNTATVRKINREKAKARKPGLIKYAGYAGNEA